MQQINIKFSDVEQIKQFVNIVDQFEVDFDLGSGRKIVDAKSILGVLALDFSEPLQLRYDSQDEKILERLAPFLS